MEREEPTERMEREADRLEREARRLDEHIDESRREWEAKKRDSGVPGAQPREDEREESHQLPEEGPPTGNPDAAGADDPGSG
jgi:hypothetical protein